MSSLPTNLPAHDVISLLERAKDVRRRVRPGDFYEPGRLDYSPTDRYQLQFHKAQHIIRAMFPGNGAGKTTVAGIEANWWLQHCHPYQQVPAWPISVIWVCLKFQQMDIQRLQLEETCLQAGWTYNGQNHRYTWPNKSSLWIISSDGDWGSIQGVAADLVVIDEECDGRLWAELTMRRRGKKKTRYVISATATKGKRWMYHRIYAPWEKHHTSQGLTEQQAVHVQNHGTRWVWPYGGIEDNPGASGGDLAWYEGELAMASAAERQVRLRGGFQDFNAAPVFDLEVIEQMARNNVARKVNGVQGSLVEVPTQRRKHAAWPAEFEFAAGMPAPPGGRITIFELPTDDNYVVGADFGYGLPNRDQDAAVVLRGSTGRQVAAASGRWGDANFGWVLWALGWFYRQALIVGERQVGLPTLRRLYDEWGYSFLYYQRDDQHQSVRHSDLLGHHASRSDLVVAYFARDLAPRNEMTNTRLPSRVQLTDPDTIKQCREFEWSPRKKNLELVDARSAELKHGAPAGQNDDLVLAAAYAALGLRELPKFIPEKPEYRSGSLGDVLGHKDVHRRIAQFERTGKKVEPPLAKPGRPVPDYFRR
jgi:hypothetical protein